MLNFLEKVNIMIKINAKKRLFADVKNLGITSNAIRKLFKLWDANILGVSTQDIVVI